MQWGFYFASFSSSSSFLFFVCVCVCVHASNCPFGAQLNSMVYIFYRKFNLSSMMNKISRDYHLNSLVALWAFLGTVSKSSSSLILVFLNCKFMHFSDFFFFFKISAKTGMASKWNAVQW